MHIFIRVLLLYVYVLYVYVPGSTSPGSLTRRRTPSPPERCSPTNEVKARETPLGKDSPATSETDGPRSRSTPLTPTSAPDSVTAMTPVPPVTLPFSAGSSFLQSALAPAHHFPRDPILTPNPTYLPRPHPAMIKRDIAMPSADETSSALNFSFPERNGFGNLFGAPVSDRRLLDSFNQRTAAWPSVGPVSSIAARNEPRGNYSQQRLDGLFYSKDRKSPCDRFNSRNANAPKNNSQVSSLKQRIICGLMRVTERGGER